MKKYLTISLLILFFTSCVKKYEAPVPDTQWKKFDSVIATSLSYNTRQKIEGIYTVVEGNDNFGEQAALKWSYTVNGPDTSFSLSMFCEKQVSYFVCEAKKIDTNILLNGYWRKMVNTETGLGRFTISQKNGAKHLLSTAAFIPPIDSIIIQGVYGNGGEVPDKTIKLKYLRPLYKGTPLNIVAHRLGGRNSDLLPQSENSVELLKLAAKFGATGVETDIRTTSDGVLVIFHDATLSGRLIQKDGLLGPIENYSYTQLNTLVRLLHGEHIPTLREVLTTLVYNTSLNFVWLDTKLQGPLQQLRDIQKEFQLKANAAGRKLDISIGIPDRVVLDNFMQLPDFRNIPAVCELPPEDVQNINAHIWGPRWTLGTQNEEVANIHAQGRKAYVWTLDVPGNIETFIREGHFDGILSNYPSAVAYYYYAQK